MAKKDADRAKQQARERVVASEAAWADADRLIGDELAALATRGVTPACTAGCAHCCRQEIVTARAEAEAVAEWIKRSWDEPRIDAFRGKLRDWLRWYREDYPKLIAAGVTRSVAFYEHGLQCVALVDNACSLYAARPLTCRTLYVSSSPDACRQETDPQFAKDVTFVPVHALVRVVEPVHLRIRAVVEKQGADYMATAHLLPEWLAHLLRVEDQPWRTTPPLFDKL
ncbi:MAG: YkgJ family cysteine cluster protein [Deltaproteobacteria bacterium]|nr:YkgJ family cysteine cluster protein [Deltaproteobacteria bacterium]